MKILIMVKQVGKRKPIIGKIDMELSQPVLTLQEMIEQIITINVKQYNNQTVEQLLVNALTEQEMQDQSELGKIGFNIQYNPNQQDIAKAITNASLSFQDGLYKVFINDVEMDLWKQEINLQDGDSVLFLKLIMLSGRQW